MNTQEFLNHLEQLNIQILFEEGDLSLRAPEGVLTPDLNSEFLSRRSELLAFLRQGQPEDGSSVGVPTDALNLTVGTPTVGDQVVGVPTEEDLYPLSHALQNLFMGMSVLGPRNLTGTLQLRGPLDTALLVRSFQVITDSYQKLRLSFPEIAGQRQQKVNSTCTVKLNRKNLKDFDRSNLPERIESLIQSENQTKIKLETGPLYRLTLLMIAPEEHYLLLTFHQGICDSTFLKVLVQEVFAQYENGASGSSEKIPLSLISQETPEQNENITELALTSPPGDKIRSGKTPYRNGVETFLVNSELLLPLRQLLEKDEMQLRTGLLAVFQYLLATFSGEKEFLSLYHASPEEQKSSESYLLSSRIIEENGFLEYLQAVWIETERAFSVGAPPTTSV